MYARVLGTFCDFSGKADRPFLRAGIDAATDREIDRLVYDLYGLTEDEIAIVEGAP